MERRGELLVSTFGKDVGEIVAGIRALPHDHVILVTERSLGESDAALSLLDRLGIRREVLMVDPSDIAGSALLIERKVQERIDKGWRARVDITGGRKLLSDAAMLAALSTGAEVCCFETEARRFPLLAAMGVREALPKDLAEVLRSQNWPIPLEEVRKKGRDHPLPPLLRRLKSMDLVQLEGRETPMISLTERGRACREWIERTSKITGS